jgi:hypothetical protein
VRGVARCHTSTHGPRPGGRRTWRRGSRCS